MNSHKNSQPYYPVISCQCKQDDQIIQSIEAELEQFQHTVIHEIIKPKGCLKTELKYVSSPTSSPKGRSREQVISAAKQQIIDKVAERGRFPSADLNNLHKQQKQIYIEHLNQSTFNEF